MKVISKSKIKGFLLYHVYRPLQRMECKLPNFICSFFPMTDTIIMESNPDLADNTYEVYRYIIEHNILPNYKIVWRVNDPTKYDPSVYPTRVSFIPIHPRKKIERIKSYLLINRAKIVVDCNRHYPKYKTSGKQLNVYLDHGMPLKDMTKYNHPLGLSCSYVISQSAFFTPYICQQYGISQRQVIVAGVPRDDQLFIKHNTLRQEFPEYDSYTKIIAWVPTFRKMASGGRIDCIVKQPYGMPVFQTIEDVDTVNSKLSERNILLLIKPHPAQDLSFLDKVNSSNIKVLYNDDMLSHGIQTNELLEQTDAMITDYSGIYYDYLLLRKPIAVTLDDYQDYKKQKGFVFDDPLTVIKGRKIYCTRDFVSFIEEVDEGIDASKEERDAIDTIVNENMNGESAKRVVDFLLSIVS